MHGEGPVSDEVLTELITRVTRKEAEDEALGPPNPEFLAILDDVNRPPTAAETAEFERDLDRQRCWTRAHPAYEAARAYGFPAADVALAWQELPEIAGDSPAAAALQSIIHFAYLIPAKTARALHGLYDRAHGEDEDIAMDDANGTAKLVRLGLSESREGWTLLIAHDRTGTELPRSMIGRLDALDAQLANLFPDAMGFIREGLNF